MLDILTLETKAEDEIYTLIDKHLKPLPKNADGTINKEAKGFQHNDVDALRHAYVSGVYTMEYSEKTAAFLGELRERFPGTGSIGTSGPNQSRSKNMDLWNNSIGRKYGKQSKTREKLFQHLLQALKNGELIIGLDDKRKYSSNTDMLIPKDSGQVIVVKESETGENLLFLDTHKALIFSREEFVTKIKNGEYKDYEIRKIKDREIPTSKRDGIKNLD